MSRSTAGMDAAFRKMESDIERMTRSLAALKREYERERSAASSEYARGWTECAALKAKQAGRQVEVDAARD